MANENIIVFGVDGLIPELVLNYSNRGLLPNIKKMMDMGSTTELLPFISTWGDLNWVSFINGQSPGTCWVGQGKPTANSNNLLANLDEIGKKAALVHFPASVTVKGTNHFELMPFSGVTNKKIELCEPTLHTTNSEKWHTNKTQEKLGWPPVGTLAHHEKRNLQSIEYLDDQSFHFSLLPHYESSKEVQLKIVDPTKVELQIDQSYLDLTLGQWSEWCKVQFDRNSGYVRFKLVDLDVEQKHITVLQSQVNALNFLSNDKSIEEEIIKRNGPFISKWTVKASPEEPYYETSFEEGAYQAEWLAKTALYLIEEKGFSLFSTVFRLNDETHHTCLGKVDKASPFYNESEVELYENTIIKAYQVLDQAIGILLDNKSDSTSIILASDHGDVPNSYFCDIYKKLEEANLVQLNDSGEPILSHSKVFLKDDRGGLEIFINKQQVFKDDQLNEERYKEIQEETILTLSNWVHDTPKGKMPVVERVIRKQEAASIGYWGEHVGDIIFTYNQGFVWGTDSESSDTVREVSKHGANHGPQSPWARTDDSSNLGVFIATGKSFKQSKRKEIADDGYYKMNDCGKTIAKILEVSSQTLDGDIMEDLLASLNYSEVGEI